MRKIMRCVFDNTTIFTEDSQAINRRLQRFKRKYNYKPDGEGFGLITINGKEYYVHIDMKDNRNIAMSGIDDDGAVCINIGKRFFLMNSSIEDFIQKHEIGHIDTQYTIQSRELQKKRAAAGYDYSKYEDPNAGSHSSRYEIEADAFATEKTNSHTAHKAISASSKLAKRAIKDQHLSDAMNVMEKKYYALSQRDPKIKEMGWNKWFQANIPLYNKIKKDLADTKFNDQNQKRKLETALRHDAIDDPDIAQRRKMYSDGSVDKGIEKERNGDDKYSLDVSNDVAKKSQVISAGDAVNKRYTEKAKLVIDKSKLSRISNIVKEKMSGRTLREAMTAISNIEKMIDDGKDGFTKNEYDALVTECHLLADTIHDWNQTTTGEKIKF